MIGCYLTAEQIRRMDYVARDLRKDRTATIIHLVDEAYEASRAARRRPRPKPASRPPSPSRYKPKPPLVTDS